MVVLLFWGKEGRAMRLVHKYKGLAEQLLSKVRCYQIHLKSALLAWSQHAFVNAATVHVGPPPFSEGQEFKMPPEELKRRA